MSIPSPVYRARLCAFDYSAQRWVEGEAARPLLIAQFQAEVDLLSGASGESYATFLCVDRAQALASATYQRDSLRA